MGNKELTFTFFDNGAGKEVRFSEIEQVLDPEEFYELSIKSRQCHLCYHTVSPRRIIEILNIHDVLSEKASISVFPGERKWH